MPEQQTKPEPKPADQRLDSRESARAALQTSMDRRG
jgi:hypothetical protein